MIHYNIIYHSIYISPPGGALRAGEVDLDVRGRHVSIVGRRDLDVK